MAAIKIYPQVYEYLETHCHDESAKFIRVLTKGTRSHLVWEDFNNLIQDVIDTHPGMSFLDDAPEFHARLELQLSCFTSSYSCSFSLPTFLSCCLIIVVPLWAQVY